MAYTKTTWVNNQAPAINADNLNKIEDGIYNSVRYADAQTLTDAQKQQARANIAAAPDGYGLGGGAVVPPNNSIDDAKVSGLYHCSPVYVGAPSGHAHVGHGTVLSMRRGADSVIQVYWAEASSNITGTPLNLVRRFDGTKWYPWEWVNPPMASGVEYRTTERYKGSPVYVKLVDAGVMPSSGVKSVAHGIANIAQIAGFHAQMTTGTDGSGISLPFQRQASYFANAAVNDTNITLWADDNLSIYTHTYCTIKYTKTTD